MTLRDLSRRVPGERVDNAGARRAFERDEMTRTVRDDLRRGDRLGGVDDQHRDDALESDGGTASIIS